MARLALDRALELDAEYVELRWHTTNNEEYIYKNGALDTHQSFTISGIALRVLVDGVMSFSSTNIITEKNIISMVEDAINNAKASSRLAKRKVSLYENEIFEVKYVVAENKKWVDATPEEKMEILKSADDNVLDKIKGPIKSMRLYILGFRKEEKIVVNSFGTYIQSSIPLVWIKYVITLKNSGKSVQKIGRKGGSGGLEIIDNFKIIDKITETAYEMSQILKRGKPTPTGLMDIIVGSEVAGIIAHECVGHPFEADRILGREAAQAGGSYLSPEDIGKQIGSKEVNVSDDPTIPSSGGYYLYDDEGVKARKKRLILNGKVNEYLHNRETAEIFGVGSNASARAVNYNREPIVRMSNTYFEAGDYSFDELLEEIKEGIYMKGFMEWNIDDKRLNQRYTGLEAYYIRNGEIKYPVLMPVIEITTYQLLSSLDARGRDVEFFMGLCGKGEPHQPIPVWFGGPSLRFRNINIRRRAS